MAVAQSSGCEGSVGWAALGTNLVCVEVLVLESLNWCCWAGGVSACSRYFGLNIKTRA